MNAWARNLADLYAGELADVDELAARARAGVVYAERPWPTTPRPELEFVDPRLVPARLAAEEPPTSTGDGSIGSGGPGSLRAVDEFLQATFGMTALVLMLRAIQTGILVSVFDRIAHISRGLAPE